VSPRDDGPRSIGESLRELVSRFKKVDLDVMDEILRRWPALVGEAVASRCEPQVVREGVLYVRVPNGAYAETLARLSAGVIEGLSDLGERAPRAVRSTVGDAVE
jgi:hypothetical protein